MAGGSSAAPSSYSRRTPRLIMPPSSTYPSASSTPAARLLPASGFTIEALTAAYNQTRVDYLIPMPMTSARLAEYIRLYDVDLEHSWVAVDGAEVLGLAMLGVRPGRAWVTRLGVLPASRRRGTGEVLVQALLQSAAELGLALDILEVIKENAPARALFRKLGFHETRELLVLRRPAGPPAVAPVGEAAWLEMETALDLLAGELDAGRIRLPWTNEIETYRNGGDALGLRVALPAADDEPPASGWMVFRRQVHGDGGMLSHFVLRSETGSPRRVASALAAHLYRRYVELPSDVENLPAGDPHLGALLDAGFSEAFRRIEMELRAG